MTLDFGFIAHSAYREAEEEGRFIDRAMDFPMDVFTDTRRTYKKDDGALGIFFEFANSKVFEDALFHVFQAVVILVENSCGFSHVNFIGRRVSARAEIQSSPDSFRVTMYSLDEGSIT